ncbi:hypothetical protein FRB99_000852 [Tulasnella sp. 403]|nr:hypothetical protein FRB99_000852 [Tulasnella sp. 403]
MSTAATANYPHSFTPSSPFQRRQLPATPLHLHTAQLPPPLPTYSPLSSGLPSPNFPSPIPLPATMPARGRSPGPASASSSRQPSRQQSVRRLSSAFPSRNPSIRQPLPYEHPDVSTIHEEVLSEGDIIGQGDLLHGEPIQLVRIPTSAARDEPQPADHLQVVCKLGAGSYAVVYLVREIISRTLVDRPATAEPDDLSDSDSLRYRYDYGREFAVKVLSKANLTKEQLEIQLFEATLHQSLPTHPNIVTLLRTLQSDSFLLLVLDYVPGQDLYYFLEQARDASLDIDSAPRPLPPLPGNALMIAHTPSTPSLLSAQHPQHLLSYQRLRLITSMFSQMCDAVDACHAQGVSHRDIKPENFIVTEGYRNSGSSTGERKVVVKLSDFGLATLQQESKDVDCGSATYMSFECRNNVAPTYATQPADVWSLGIVLINMLYHHNPWDDTATFATSISESRQPHDSFHPNSLSATSYVCGSFSAFIANPVNFFLQRFPGMTYPVADFLANRVFCILPNMRYGAINGYDQFQNIGTRVTAREFGQWIKALPSLMGQGAQSGIGMGAFSAGPSVRQLPLSKLSIDTTVWTDDASREPTVAAKLQASILGSRSEVESSLLMSPAHGVSNPASNLVETEESRPTVARALSEVGEENEGGEGDNDQTSLRSPSVKKRGKRGKRGARREDRSQPPGGLNLSTTPEVPKSPGSTVGDYDEAKPVISAADVQQFASEISRTLKSSASRTSVASGNSRRSSRMSAAERALARLPPMPSVPPPLPPTSSAVSERSMSPTSFAGLPSSPPHEPPRPPLSPVREREPERAPPVQHEGVAAILGSKPAGIHAPRKGWKGWLGITPSSGAHAAPQAHESPASLATSSRAAVMKNDIMSSTSLASTSTTAKSVRSNRSGHTTAPGGAPMVTTVIDPPRSNAPAPAGRRERSPVNSVRQQGSAKPRIVPHPGAQWVSEEDGTARVNDLEPVSSAYVARRNLAGSQWSSVDEERERALRGGRSFPSPAVNSSAASIMTTTSSGSRKMDGNWRTSMSSASSTFTRFSNSSVRSVSTMATTVSSAPSVYRGSDGASWRSPPSASSTVLPGMAGGFNFMDPAIEQPPRPRKQPGVIAPRSNIKNLDGVPAVLVEYPRALQPKIKGVLPNDPYENRKKGSTSNNPPSYPSRHRASPPLDSISESQHQRGSSPQSSSPTPVPTEDGAYMAKDAAASVSDLDPEMGGVPRKGIVHQKSQGFKMFSFKARGKE